MSELLELDTLNTGVDFEDIVMVTMNDEGYSVNGELLQDYTLGLLQWIENNLPILEEVTDVVEEVDTETHIVQLAQAGNYRRGVIAAIQEETVAYGFSKQMMVLFNYGDEYIESWKFSGDTALFDEQLSASQSVKLRAALDMPINAAGFTVQMYLLARITTLTATST